ncbi:MAG: GNAT family N-acetyltransferase [Kofleriaceae bacterium]|jgi:predicted N-acyltransferase|nr:GNAT family N-acetyltransferase [Kofleriaceae bacterium]MBP9166004.1 GNAT family N-acetyltransferase [Kofleriaceae bacterium]MBP9857317.1 GNAT family N-acetyltransferase [Kofleriaceae bacterium]
MASTDLAWRVVASIAELDRGAWDRLDHGPSPFLRHGFLTALEASGSIGRRAGWQPAYVVVEAGGELIGAVAAFVKRHSYGEYIFDWAWAGAAERAGLAYYPKLVVAAPITPATGTRLLIAPGADVAAVTAALVAGVREVADATDCSSIHWLFCTADEQARLVDHGFIARASFQFHWPNRGYQRFDDFLAALASRKRKQVRKERARVAAAIDRLRWRPGPDLDAATLDRLDRYYRSTTEAHGGHDYLRPGFFHRVAAELPAETWLVEVEVGGAPAAGALFFETAHGLYGRYWGSDVAIDCLHFETAYYAGIERCIAHGLPRFEAGAQGEHKLVRGFVPTATYSAHWLRHPGLHAAIVDFCARERVAVEAQMAELDGFGPYRADEP